MEESKFVTRHGTHITRPTPRAQFWILKLIETSEDGTRHYRVFQERDDYNKAIEWAETTSDTIGARVVFNCIDETALERRGDFDRAPHWTKARI